MTLVLEEALVSLANELADESLLLCGGFGLVLRHRHLVQENARTLWELVQVRSTEDVDILLTEEIITDPTRTKQVRDAFATLQYEAIAGAKYFQFSKAVSLGGQERKLKFDLLAPKPTQRSVVKIKGPRIRPHGVENIHARLTPEAFSAHEHPTFVEIGKQGQTAQVQIVHPFTHIVMKLYALRDRCMDSQTDFGRRHALDIYRLLAMTTTQDWEIASKLVEKYAAEPAFMETQRAVETLFLARDGMGRLRLREGAKQAGLTVEPDEVAEHLQDWFGFEQTKS